MSQKRRQGKPKMRITILGSGTSLGSPIIGQQTKKKFQEPKNNRLRASCLVEPLGPGKGSILIDTSPDLRQQVLRFFPARNPRLDAVLVTHDHADHIHGIDDIRPFNFYQGGAIPFYGEKKVLEAIQRRFAYIFSSLKNLSSSPKVQLQPVADDKPFRLQHTSHTQLQKIEILPLPVAHGKMKVLGYRIGTMAYITDCHKISPQTLGKLKNLDLLILSCLRVAPHPTHLHVEAALDYARSINAKKTVFTHMSHELEYEKFRKILPPRIVPAYDGLRLYVQP